MRVKTSFFGTLQNDNKMERRSSYFCVTPKNHPLMFAISNQKKKMCFCNSCVGNFKKVCVFVTYV